MLSRFVVDVGRHLSPTSPFLVAWLSDLTKGQTGLICEGLHAMLEVAAKVLLKPIFFPAPQVQGHLFQKSSSPIHPC